MEGMISGSRHSGRCSRRPGTVVDRRARVFDESGWDVFLFCEGDPRGAQSDGGGVELVQGIDGKGGREMTHLSSHRESQ